MMADDVHDRAPLWSAQRSDYTTNRARSAAAGELDDRARRRQVERRASARAGAQLGRARRSRPAPRVVAVVTIVRAESEVGLPNGPSASASVEPAVDVDVVLADAGVLLAVGPSRSSTSPDDARRS